MSSDGWRATTFLDLISAGALEVGDGYRAKNSELDGDGPLFLRSGRVSDNYIDFTGEEHLAAALVPSLKGKLGQPRDTVVTTKGNSIGVTAYVSASAPVFVYSPHLSYWRSRDASVIVPGFLRYWARSAAFRNQLSAMGGSTDMAPYLSLVDQKRLRMELPPADDQRRVAGVLGALDDKIEGNRKLAETVNRLLELIFVSRLTAFAEGQSAALTTIADFVNGGAFTKYANGVGRPIIRIKELNDGVGESTPRTDHEVADKNVARHHDLLFSWSGSLDAYRWAGPESIINQHIFKVIPRDGYPHWFVEGWLRRHLPEFQAIAREKATTMGHIKRHHLDDALVDIPDAELLAELDAMLGPLDDVRGSFRLESRRLAAIRDALLPKLVSGRIRVPESFDPDDALGTVVEQAAVS